MRRRTFLASVAGAAFASAGCTGPARREPSESTQSPVAGRTAELPVPRSALRRSVAPDAIPAIIDPEFGTDWDRIETPALDPLDRVIGLESTSGPRAYPLRVLKWHEIVNDGLPRSDPMVVTYCPLCASGITAERVVRGDVTRFGVSGLLWDSNLVMYDEQTGSLWSQIDALAIRGPVVGETLPLVPSMLTTWGEWSDQHDDTQVLLPPPHSGTIGDSLAADYASDPYAMYDPYGGFRAAGGSGASDVERVGGFPHPKEWVFGITANRTAKAYPLGTVGDAGVANDRVGDRPVVVTVGRDQWTFYGYDRRVNGRDLGFDRLETGYLRGGGSRWRVSDGLAVDGPHDGTTLEPVLGTSMFWFAWADRYPETQVYGVDG